MNCKNTTNDANEVIEVGYPNPRYRGVCKGPGAPKLQGPVQPQYEFRHFAVPKPIADICRKLDVRRNFGIHITALGGIDTLAELAMWGIDCRTVAKPKLGTGYRECWVVPDVVFRLGDAIDPKSL